MDFFCRLQAVVECVSSSESIFGVMQGYMGASMSCIGA